MSNKIVNDIRKLRIHKTPKYLLWVISDIADDNGHTTWYAPRSRLMEETGYSHETIATSLAYLEECGILQIVKEKGRQNQYVVTPENFNSSIEYEPKKQSKPVSLADQSGSQPRSPTKSASLTRVVSLSEKPVSHADTIPHIPHYPSIYPSLGDSANTPKVKPKPKAKRITKKQIGINRLVELGCEEKYAHDWMVARKGAELTDSIIENLNEQSRKANITVAQAVEWSAKKGYQGFKADWYLKDQQVQQPMQANHDPFDGYFSKFKQPQEPDYWYDPIDVTPKKTVQIEGVGHA